MKRAWCIWVLAAACGGNHAPVLEPIADQSADVGVELSIELRATDADGDALVFDFDAPDLPDIKTRAMVSTFASNVAIFRWTPEATDASIVPWAFDFKVSDGKATTTETVQITVGGMGGAAPVFRQPLGTGTTLDLTQSNCIDVSIVVEDTDSTQVVIAEDDPQIDGSTLTQTDAFDADWNWCPTAAQIAAQDRYLLHLSADDGTNHTTKSYLIVLRSGTMMNCPGMPPVITHTPPGAQSTLLDIPITAMITDDVGIKAAPIVYYSTTAPATPPDLTKMSQVTLSLTAGDGLSGTYSGTLPNPVASGAAGSSATLYYVLEAKDNDDPTGACDHVVDSTTFAIVVTNPGGNGSLMACDACTADAQCSTGFDCIHIGTSTGTFCARECTGSPPCATGYSCSPSGSLITSVGGKMARYCRPSTLSCAPTCTDDTFEENDTQTMVTNPQSADLTSGAAGDFNMTFSNLVMCADGTNFDEDFYGVPILADSIVTTEMKIKNYLTGGTHADLDIFLLDGAGDTLALSDGVTSTEYLSACVPKASGKSWLDVLTFDQNPVSSKYDLTVTRTGPDANEGKDDDSTTTVSLDPGSTFNQNICNSDDWFWTYLHDGTPLVVDLKYSARVQSEELDVKLMRDNNSSPTEVTAGAPVDGGARLSYDSPDGGEDFYYVVVGATVSGGGNSYTLKTVQAPPLQ
jgi:hypothetical protein